MGHLVGYQIRFERKISKNTKVCTAYSTFGFIFQVFSDERKIQAGFDSFRSFQLTFMTEGLLLRLLASSSAEVIRNHKVIILDEVHERHISCDFLVGLIKCLVVRNEDLRVILMSATANLQLFSNYFDNCPVIEVSGLELFTRTSALGFRDDESVEC